MFKYVLVAAGGIAVGAAVGVIVHKMIVQGEKK